MSGPSAADEVFSKLLRELYEAAGSPDLATLVRQGEGQKPPVSLSDATLSDWLTGRAVPRKAKETQFRFVVEYLEGRAGTRGTGHVRWGADRWIRLCETARRVRGSGTGTAGSRATGPGSVHDLPRPPRAAVMASATLPAARPHFSGRRADIERMLSLLGPSGAPALVVSGMAGVGKTTLASQVARKALQSGLFADALFIDVNGYDPAAALGVEVTTRKLLRYLGVDPTTFGNTADDLVATFRSALAAIAEPVLLVLDNAADSAQVEALLPGHGPHRSIVTSRHLLTVLSGASTVRISPFDTETAVAMIDAMLRQTHPGDSRVEHEPDAAARLAELCGHLPLALEITAARLLVDPYRTLAAEVVNLAEEHGRLAKLKHADKGQRDVRAAIELSYQRLDHEHRRMLRLLGVNPRHALGESAAFFQRQNVPIDPVITTEAAAELADRTIAATYDLLHELSRAHLVEIVDDNRWRLHDLVHLYLDSLPVSDADRDDFGPGILRLVDYWVRSEMVERTTYSISNGDGQEIRLQRHQSLGRVLVIPDELRDALPGLDGFVWNEDERVFVEVPPSWHQDRHAVQVARNLSSDKPTTLDQLASRCRLTVPDVRAAMLVLQQAGVIGRVLGAHNGPLDVAAVPAHARWRADRPPVS